MHPQSTPSMVECVCAICGTPFLRKRSQAAKYKSGPYCSRVCAVKGRPARQADPDNHVACTCETCGKAFTIPAAWARKKGAGRYCSKECRAAASPGRYDDRGYVMVRVGPGEWRHEHRVVMEQELGRPLETQEHVHHKEQGRKSDNSLDNLELLPRAEHIRLHGLAQKQGRWGVGYDACAGCGTTERRHKGDGLCERCFRRRRTERDAIAAGRSVPPRRSGG